MTRSQQFQIQFTVDRLDLKAWADCQKFYKLDGDFGKNPEEHTIKIPGLRRKLKPHQAYAVYWMLKTEKRLNGGYLADDMGLGKVSMLATVQASLT
jgi:SNF2 family DNA or RNA helicase